MGAFNKLDQVDGDTLELAREEYPQAILISASERLGLETLRRKLAQLIHYTVSS